MSTIYYACLIILLNKGKIVE